MKIVTERLKFADLFPEQASKLAQKLHIKKDEIPFIRKFYTSEKAEVDKKERSVISYISTAAKDRDNEQLLPGGVTLENYRKNPVVLYGHDYHSLPIGKNIWIKQDEKGLIAKTVFAKSEFADHIYRAYTEDIEGTGPLLKAWSVGFIPTKWTEPKEKDGEDAPRRIYTEWELLEYSAVPVPSCPEALTLAYQKGLIPDALKSDLQEDVDDLDITIDEDPEITIDPDEPSGEEKTVGDLTDDINGEDWETWREGLSKDNGDCEEETVVVEGGEVETKAFDMAGNPSVRDIMDAISSAVSTDNQDDWNHVADLYPVKYPNGHVVISESKRGEQRKHLLYTYEYDDGVIKLGESKELEASYRPKKDSHVDIGDLQSVMKEVREELAILKEGRILSKKSREAVENAKDALVDLLQRDDDSRVKPEEEVSTEELDVPIEIEKDIDIPDLDDKISKAIEKALNADKIKKAIEEGIDIAIKKVKGKVE